MKFLIVCVAIYLSPWSAIAREITIPQLPSATGQLTGSELTPVSQNGMTKQATVGQIDTPNTTNANAFNDASALASAGPTCNFDSGSPLAVGFTDENCLEITENGKWGTNSYGGGTNAKTTFLPVDIIGNYAGWGQRFLLGETQNCYGMGDCFAETKAVNFATADISGDEGQGFQSVSYLQQQSSLTETTLTSAPVRTACNTTLVSAVTGAPSVQTVAVTSVAGCSVNDWVVVDEQAPSNTPNLEAVQLTAVGSGTVGGIFRLNHNAGATVTPATVLQVASSAKFGLGRVLVDLSGANYSTGTVSSIVGGAFTGIGTAWSSSMVGGSSPVYGCIALTADQYTGTPFGSSNPLNSWYQILGSVSATSLGIYSTSVAGDAAYHGYGPGSGGYVIRPCAEVLAINNGEIIIETNSFTWANGDTVELAIPPYPDVTGYQYDIAVYTAGGVRRQFMNVLNTGARTFANAIFVGGNMTTGGNADTAPFNYAIETRDANRGIYVDASKVAGITLNDEAANGGWGNPGKIDWPAIGDIYPDQTFNGMIMDFPNLKITKNLYLATLPTAAPVNHCEVWSNAGVLTLTTCP